MRIISLVPSHSEILFALGLGEHVVGVTVHCDYPTETENVEQVGAFGDPDWKKIIALRPDLVLLDGRLQRRSMKELKRAGIRVFDFSPSTLDELFDGMERLSSAAGGGESSRQVIDGLRLKAGELRDAAGSIPSCRLLFVMGGGDVLLSPGPESMQYGVFSSLGLELYPSAAQVPFIPITWRDAAHFDPQILLVCGRSPGQPERKRCSGCRIKKRPCIRDVQDIYRISDLAGVSSVRESKVFTVPCHFFCRPGPRLLEGMQWLLKSLSAE